MILKVTCACLAALLIMSGSLGDLAGVSSVIPCPFNPMCLCRLNRAPGTQVDEHLSATWYRPTGGGRWAGSTDRRGRHHPHDDDESSELHLNVSDVSCVGVSFASVPALPRSHITHFDMVNTGIEYVNWPDESRGSAFITPAQIDSVRLMGNRILHISESSFRSMADDLKSLDLSFNELDEIPVRAVKMLRVLDWANFHGNQIASLEGLSSLWSHWSPTLRALFLGSNEISVLEKSQNGALRDVWRHEETEHHHSLSALRNLYWLNIDGNLLTDLVPESLPPRLHTLSAANNRLSQFPMRVLESLRDLSGLDLRGNCIHQLPTASVRTGDESGSLNGAPKLRLEKLDLGENLINVLPENGESLFNGSVHVRDLYLDYNRINRLPDSSLRGTFVSRLHLSANGLTKIDDRAFSSLSSTLVYLDLNRNKLKQIPSALSYLKRLRFLHLGANQLKKLQREDFVNFGHHLQVLSLNENQLEQFPWGTLNNCSNLVELNLAYNQIENVTSAMFHDWAHDLEVLNLKGNQIMHLPARLFRFAPKLRELNLSFNKLVYASEEALADAADSLEKIEMNMAIDPSRAAYFPAASLIKQLHQLQWLSLDYNRLTYLPSTVFDHLHKLVYLSLEGNKINQISSSIGPLVLKGGKLRSLKVLRLTHNHLETLASRTFHNFHDLTNVALDHNRIQLVESLAFDHLPKVTHIGLGHNRIEQLEERSFRWLPNLVELNLNFNRLREFCWDAISNCTNPVAPAKLNISYNSIVKLGSMEDAFLLYFSVIDASHNLLGSFPGKEFFSPLAPKSLYRLILHHNRIDRIEDGALSLGCRRLQMLDMGHNRIKGVARDAFFGASNIQMVLMNDNAIDQLSGGTFANLRKLRVVDLSGNRLRILPSDLLTNTAVEALNLAHNHLISMPSGCLSSVSSTLADLDLSYNEIEHLDSVTLSTVPHLVSLNLAHNRLTLLPDNLFSHLNNLLALDISFNAIRANYKELFHELQHVKKLNLAGIGLGRWPSMPLPKVVFLNLSSNGLEYRNPEQIPNVVIRLNSLRNLDISNNRLAIVPSFLWNFAPLLKQVDFSFNAIRTINRESFAGLTRLQTLIMRPLPLLETIESDSFQHLLFLNTLVMQTWAGLHLAHLLTGLRGLKSLSVDVRGSVLSSVHFDSIGNTDIAPKLRDVEITGNQLRIVQGDIFSNINIHSSPECSVSLKYTSIKYLPNGFVNGFAGCTSMTLDLSHNTLHTFGSQALRDNTTTSSSLSMHLLGGLRLEGNPMICTCEITWLGKWFKIWHVEKESLIDPIMRISSTSTSPIYEAFCRDPISNRKLLFIDLINSESMCSHSNVSSRGHSKSVNIFYATILTFLVCFVYY